MLLDFILLRTVLRKLQGEKASIWKYAPTPTPRSQAKEERVNPLAFPFTELLLANQKSKSREETADT